MAAVTSQVFRAGLSALWFSGLAGALSRWTAGKGAVLMLHRVRPEPPLAFSPNATLSITPRYLESLLQSFRAADIDVLSLDAALERVQTRTLTRRFVCFTLDDGYRDNLDHALPIFQRHAAPFTVYATTSYADRSLTPWWYALEYVIARAREVRWTTAQGSKLYPAGDVQAKQRTFAALARCFFAYPVAELRLQLQQLLDAHGLSVRELAERDMCSWSELRSLRHAGVEIGCHCVSHPRLLCETPETVRAELGAAREQLQAELGCTVRHLAYPYGKRDHVGQREFAVARELGFASAVTTRKGALFREHAQQRHALPRVEVTPSFAGSPRYLQTILMGLPLLAWNRGRLVVTD